MDENHGRPQVESGLVPAKDRRSFQIRDIVQVGLFTALTCIVSLILKWGGDILVPFSLLPLMALLAGVFLGGRLGAWSMLVYALMGLIGIPVFAKPPFGGPIYLLQPTFGFILGYIAAAYVTGKLVEKESEPGLFRLVTAMLAGLGVLYLVGLPYLWVIVNFFLGNSMTAATVLKVAFLPFIGLDLIKMGLGAVLANLVTKRVGSLIRRPAV
jgi:biotin transport system substrate-specific component